MGNTIIQEVEPFQLISDIGRKNKRLQAKLLQELEAEFGTVSPTMRKFILDETSGYTRSILKAIFGDVEFLIGN